MLVSNLECLPHHRVLRHLGLVQGSSVRSKHVGRDLAASFKNFFGGELRGYTELLQDSREEATSRMLEQAKAIGANAVLNVRFSTSSIAAGAAEIYVYGTAVEVEELPAAERAPLPEVVEQMQLGGVTLSGPAGAAQTTDPASPGRP